MKRSARQILREAERARRKRLIAPFRDKGIRQALESAAFRVFTKSEQREAEARRQKDAGRVRKMAAAKRYATAAKIEKLRAVAERWYAGDPARRGWKDSRKAIHLAPLFRQAEPEVKSPETARKYLRLIAGAKK